MASPLALVWLRRDLRLDDHAAIHHAQQAGFTPQCVFIFDPGILKRFTNPEDSRLSFIAATLVRMQKQLATLGSNLWVFYGDPLTIIPALCKALDCSHVFAGRGFEPDTRKRDEHVGRLLKQVGAELCTYTDHLLIPADAITKQDGTPFKVFTPYSRVWKQQLTPAHSMEYTVHSHFNTGKAFPKDVEHLSFPKVMAPHDEAAVLKLAGYRYNPSSFFPVDQAKQRLQNFITYRLKDYKTQRDRMDIDGTSILSPYLRFGLLSIRECYRLAAPYAYAEGWINELIWREFYAMILYFYPDSVHSELREEFRNCLPWEENNAGWKAFQEGKTGFPIVDAAVRQMLSKGWMHNRARMIVASFLCKDLLIDWRKGEEFFAQHLMDYELASNVGGWQWASSTGTDAQPYFRIFNPTLQSQRFDPQGNYIRAYVPELKALTGDAIHEPYRNKQYSAFTLNYPPPIVDHSHMREVAIRFFKENQHPRQEK